MEEDGGRVLKGETGLIHRNDFDAVVGDLLEKERSIVDELEKIVPYVTNASIKDGLERRMNQSREHVSALEAGYIPVSGGYFMKTDTKTRWNKSEVKELVDDMPEEVKDAWKKAEALGVFKSFAVSGTRRGDPMLVGNAGRKHFMIGFWLNFDGGYATGFVYHPRTV